MRMLSTPGARKLKLLDLFCCAGGATRGYQRAGWHVTGVDKNKSSNYCGDDFVEANVLELTLDYLKMFDAIHASPPCQFATALNNNKSKHRNFIPGTRRRLQAAGVPYIIENVMRAAPHLRNPIMLCGTMFGLGAQGCELQRHRLFESNIPISPPCGCRHSGGPVIGVYGAHARKRSARHGGRSTKDVWIGGHPAAASEAMGMHGTTLAEMSEAIPPAYTAYLGTLLRDYVNG